MSRKLGQNYAVYDNLKFYDIDFVIAALAVFSRERYLLSWSNCIMISAKNR